MACSCCFCFLGRLEKLKAEDAELWRVTWLVGSHFQLPSPLGVAQIDGARYRSSQGFEARFLLAEIPLAEAS